MPPVHRLLHITLDTTHDPQGGPREGRKLGQATLPAPLLLGSEALGLQGLRLTGGVQATYRSPRFGPPCPAV